MTIRNLDRLNTKLDRLGNIDMAAALTQACLVVENDAKVNAPVDTGQLRASITHEITGDKGRVGTNVEYAPYVEYGTGLFSSKGGGRDTPWSYQDSAGAWHTTSGQHPQPFLQPALDSNRKEIVQTLKKALEGEVKNIV